MLIIGIFILYQYSTVCQGIIPFIVNIVFSQESNLASTLSNLSSPDFNLSSTLASMTVLSFMHLNRCDFSDSDRGILDYYVEYISGKCSKRERENPKELFPRFSLILIILNFFSM